MTAVAATLGRAKHGLVRTTLMALLVACTAPPAAPAAAPTATPSPARMLAAINARDADRPDTTTDEAAAQAEFDRILDCVVTAYGSAESEQHAGDVLYRSWVSSGKSTTLLEWARAFC